MRQKLGGKAARGDGNAEGQPEPLISKPLEPLQITDEGLAALGALTDLKELSVQGCTMLQGAHSAGSQSWSGCTRQLSPLQIKMSGGTHPRAATCKAL